MPADARVVAAVSGGADSMALVYLLRQLHEAGDCRLVGVAHLNHGLRGGAADQDETLCRETARKLGVEFYSERIDVADLARERRMSIENAGHHARYEFFDRAARCFSADRVAVGHSRDDQAETFLLRLLRGAGPKGLGGMHPRHGLVIRPLLDCSRAELRQFVANNGIRFSEDATNQDASVPRNRVRRDVLPLLTSLSPDIVKVLDREAAIAREDASFLDQVAAAAFDQVAIEKDGLVEFDRVALVDHPPAIARRVIAHAMRTLSGGRFVGFDHVDAVVDLVRSARPTGVRRHLPGLHAERRGDRLVLRQGDGEGRNKGGTAKQGTNSFRFSLSIPGEAVSPDGWRLSAERHALDPETRRAIDDSAVSPSCAFLDAALIAPPLTVRGWQPGDRFRPLGMSGSKKLQDLFVDCKVPREARQRVPLVVDAADHLVWVAGLALAADFRVTASTFDVVILKLKYWRNGT